MAKTTSPILSIGARGQIGKSMVFASWRGVSYARQLVTPSNPNSSAQQTTRNTFSALSDLWKRMPTTGVEPYNAASQGRPLTARNQFPKTNLSGLRGASDMSSFSGSPGARGGIPPTSLSDAGGAASGEIDVNVGAPDEPTGWTLDSIQAIAFQDRDPATSPTDFPVTGSDSSPTAGSSSSVNISGLETGTDYVVSAWTVWTRPDGRTAYGPSLTSIITSGS